MLHAAKRTLLRLEGKAPRKKYCPVTDLWEGYPGALATLGIKIALELRSRNVKVPLEFFAVRVPKHDFDIPEWL